MRITKKLLNVLLMMCLLISLSSVFVLAETSGAGGGSVPYIQRSWDGSKVVYTTEYAENVTAVPSNGKMTKGWYYLNSNVTVNGRISLAGDTYLILGNGFTLDVKNIYIPKDYTLTIYAQSSGNNAGTINAHASDGAAIGGYSGHKGGSIVIHGGNITAKGASHCAGIGSNDGHATTAPITIYGGKITATGGSDGAGIGGGRNCDGGTITIYGGTVTAKGGGENGAGIGGGDSSNGGTIKIYGGTITANEDPNEDGAAIGGGDGANGGNITISGGTVKTWSRDGACIGGGDDGDGGTITINGGTITCRDEGSAQGARIGGGSDADGGNITINGGKIDVYSRDGAGIGGGEDGDGGTIRITGGTVTTHPEGQGNAAGIGGGNHSGAGGTITITGGNVTAESKHGAGIGGGRADDPGFFETEDNSGAGGNVTISGGKVDAASYWAYGIGAGGSCRERGTQFSSLASEIGSAGTITIDGKADVTAEGYLAGIGGDSGTIKIKNGTAKVSGYDDDDGYGIHLLSDDGKVTISGGMVEAHGVAYCAGISCERGTVTISGGTVNAFAGRGAAIGTGMDDGTVYNPAGRNNTDEGRYIKPQGKLIIEGKDTEVHATSWYNGLGGIECGTMGTWIFRNGATIEVTITKTINAVDTERSFYDGARITAGSTKENAVPLKAEQRATAYANYKYRLMEPCDHVGTSENGWCWACGAVLEPSYIEYDWVDGELKSEEKTAHHPASFPKSTSIDGGTYYLNKSVTIKDRVTLKGDTQLILGDGNTLKVEGLYIPEGKTLTIYGQSGGTGKLISEPDGGGAGIGGYAGHKGGNVIIHGGTIKVTGDNHCAGIGSNDGQGSYTGSFTMYHGDVTATGGSNGAGIGGGRECDSGTITIYGGTVTATGKNDSAGIGGGDSDNSSHGNAGDINIYGGNVTASSSGAGAAIGGADYGTAKVNIQGGTIKATCSGKGKGIGGGSKKTPDESVITLDYAVGATSDDISITASSFGGAVTLKKPFKNSKGVFKAGKQSDLTQMTKSALVPCGCDTAGHDWKDATCTDPKTCKICGATDGEALGHDYEDVAGTAVAATCTEPGKEADQKCSRCGAANTGAEIPALGHDWSEWGSPTTTGDKIHEERSCSRCGIKEEREIEEDHSTHSLVNIQEKPAACTDNGVKAHLQCEVCKQLFVLDEDGNLKEVEDSDLIIPATGHEEADPVKENELPATCTEDGSYDSVVYCATCDKELSRTPCTAPALGHDYQDVTGTATAATCTTAGKEADQKCSRCKDEIVGAEIPALGHDWGAAVYEWAEDNSSVTATHVCSRDESHFETETVEATGEVTKQAACRAKGETTYTSEAFENAGFDVQEKTIANIPAIGHDYAFTEWTWTGDETNGYTEATANYKCFRNDCGQTQLWRITPEASVIQPTCTEGGKTVYKASITHLKAYDDTSRSDKRYAKYTPALGHDWADATCTAPKTCERCGETDGEALGHDWGDWEVITPATETEEGVETRKCSRGDKSETRTIPVLDHVHKLTYVEANDATCAEDGNTEYWICDKGDHPCGRRFSDMEGTSEINEEDTIIYHSGHVAGEKVRENVVAPTCTVNGTFDEVTYCEKCGAELSRLPFATPALGHIPGKPETEDLVPATCEDDGSYTEVYKCKVCEAETDRAIVIIPALGHDWIEPEYVWAEDNSSVTAIRFCSRNPSHVETETVNTTSEVIKEASCESGGKTTYTATFTNGAFPEQTKIVEDIDALGHDWSTPEYMWAEDNSTVTATRVCSRDAGHVETETVKTTREVTKQPTCTAKGETTYTSEAFDNDGFEVQEKAIANISALGHDYQDVGGSAIAATCTIAGKEANKECSRCGDTIDGAEIPALGHKWSDWDETTSGSTTKKIRSCSRCGDEETIIIDGEHEHIYPNMGYAEEDAATCTNDGVREHFECSCGYWFEVGSDGAPSGDPKTSDDFVIKATGHNSANPVEDKVKQATCTEDGSYDSVVYCTVCNKELSRTPCTVPARGHEYQEVTGTATAATCTKAGKEADQKCSRCESEIGGGVIPALGHDWDEPEYTWAADNSSVTATRVCSRDNSHVETETVAVTSEVTKPATCTEKGETTYTSAVFKKSAFDVQTKTLENIDPLNHNWGDVVYEWSEDNSSVTATRICSRDESHVETETATVMSEVTKPATCTEKGETTYTAEFENEAFADQNKTLENIEPVGHNWGDVVYEWSEDNSSVTATRVCSRDNSHVETETAAVTSEVTKPAACTEKGETTYTSAEFDNSAFKVQTKTEEDINALGHDLEHHKEKSETCTEKGWKEYDTCSRCDYTTYAEIPADGHDWSEWAMVEDKEPTCTEKGIEERVCSHDATHKETREVDALGHAWGDWTETKAASETAEGERVRECGRCGEKETEVIPKVTPGDGGETPSGGDDVTPTPEPTPAPGSDPNQKSKDGTAVGEGASAASAEIAITTMKNDNDLPGSVYSKLRLRSPKQTKSSITLSWTKNSKAVKYVIYGNKCGKTTKPKKLATVKSKNTKVFKKVAGKKLRKGTYYKFIIVALDKNNNVVSTSKLIHVATKGGKYCNFRSVTVKKSVINKAKKLRKGKTLKLNAKAAKQSKKLKVSVHRVVKYESTNKKIATVSKSGKVTAKKKGTCYIYAYTQNGIYKRIKVIVK